MLKTILLIIFGVSAIIAVVFAYGFRRWHSISKEMLERLEKTRSSLGTKTFNSDELGSLPAPVQRYFRTVLPDRQPVIRAVTVEHTGTFNMSETGDNWKPFTSIQRVVTQPPGFDWNARISIMPGLSVRVHDAYIAREGILHASLFGLVSIVNLRGTPDVAEGELMRFFAEAAWYPTALLPGQGVKWEAVDDTSARATLTDGKITLTMLFRFNKDDLIESVRAEARGRTVGGKVIPTPWEGRWSNYELRDGMRIPLEGEVAWILPEGPKFYWRGHIKRIVYEFEE